MKKIKKEKEIKCDCCGWDDYGYCHEPFCATVINQERKKKKNLSNEQTKLGKR